MITITAFIVFAAIGALTRAELARRLNRPGFPWGTMAVNVSGAFLLGVLHDVSPPLLTILGTAGLGAYTTFSSFAADAIAVAQRRTTLRSATYIVATVVLGVAAAAIGRNLFA
jgi:CrcB protein